MMTKVCLNRLIPIRSDTFFGVVHTTLVDMTYHKLSDLAYKVRLNRKFEKITKEIKFKEMDEKLLKLKNKIPSRITMYDADICVAEILSITFGAFEEDERVKKIVNEITKHANADDILDINIKKWTVLRDRIDGFITEATKLLFEGTYNEEQAYHIITYIQGLTILINIIDNYEKVLLKSKWNKYDDFSDALVLIVKFLLLSLITAKYIDGDISPENYIYNMEYISEIFVKDEDDSTEIENIENWVSLLT